MELMGRTGYRTFFTIELSSGRAREIDQYSLQPQEKEVVLPTNTRLVVVSIFDAGGGLTQVHLREVEPLEPLLVFTSKAPTVAVNTEEESFTIEVL